MIKRGLLLVAIGFVMATGSVAVAQQVTTGPPVVHNGSLTSTTVATLMPGIGSGFIVWTLTNESRTDGIRCEYGGITGQPPVTPPTPRSGSLIAPGVSLTERTAPSNRLDCTAVSGTPEYDITMYPR